MLELCSEHQNKIERICLYPECQSRALCLLCDHPHGSPFRSIMAKQSESYRKFQLTVNAAVDRYLLQRAESPEEKLREEQQKMVHGYFSDLGRQFVSFLQAAEATVISQLSSSENESFTALRQARLDKNYVDVPQQLFKVLLQVYEGAELAQVFQSSERGSAEKAYKSMQTLHDSILSVMEAIHHRHKLKLPDIRSVVLEERERPADAWTNYEGEEAPKKWEVKLGRQSTCEFDSIISDCLSFDSRILCASYDKKLRMLDRNLMLTGQLQYSNIITKVQRIGEDVFAVALSKEILIERLGATLGGREQLMKLSGHAERISDLHALNTRILASCSIEGVKVWDLYHERCEYTLREESSPTAIRFLPASNAITVGYNSHQLKAYSNESMRPIKKYDLPGVVTLLDQGKCPEKTFYAGSFPSSLTLIDLRMASPAVDFRLPVDAPTCLVDSVNDQATLAVGDRGGNVNLLDLRTRKVRMEWVAHAAKTHLSRPRGVVGLIEQQENCWISAGSNDRLVKIWELRIIQ